MSSSKNILLQFDGDPVASSFDAVVAVDAGTDVLVPYPALRLDQVTGLVHGAMFTRSPAKLKHTAIFVGGSNVEWAEQCYHQVLGTFFGPVRVSVAMDANGCNTTSVAAVDAGLQSLKQGPDLVAAVESPRMAFVLGGTGPVGQRIARLLLEQGWRVQLHSRSEAKAVQVANALPAAAGSVVGTAASGAELTECLVHSTLIFNASAAGVESVSAGMMTEVIQSPGALVDLNAVPPAGIAGVDPRDRHRSMECRLVSGALAVGEWKMKLHRAMLQRCFSANDLCFNLQEIAALSRELQVQNQTPV